MADDQGSEPSSRVPGRAEPPRPQPRPQPIESTRTVSVDITPRQLRVVPGQSETATVNIRYHGSVITELTLALSGDAAAWTRVAPDVINVYPDTDAQAILRFDPPRAPSTRAGLTDFALQVYSSTDPTAATAIQRPIEVASFDELVAEAAGPTALSDKREAALPIKVRNRGNRPVQVSVRASTIGSVDLMLSTESMYLDPGGEATVWVNVSARRRMAPDAPRTHPFTIVVSSDRSPPVTIDGRFEQPSPAARPGGGNRRLLLGLAGAAMLTGAMAVAGVAIGIIKLPAGATETNPPATSTNLFTIQPATGTAPVTNPPTDAPITQPPTQGPVTNPPTDVPITEPPTQEVTPSPYALAGWQKVPGDIKFNQAPAVAGWDPTRTIILAPDDAGRLYWNRWDGAQWGTWEQVGNGTLANFKPAAVSWGPERVDAFAILDDKQMYQLTYENGVWGSWQLVGPGGFTTGPAATTWFAGRLDVFAAGTDETMYHAWYDQVNVGSFWNAYEPIGSPSLLRAPAAIAWPSGRIDVFGLRNLPGEYERLSYPDPVTLAGFSDWYESWGGSFRNAPAVASPFEGRIDLFGRWDDDGTLYQRTLDGGVMNDWHQVSPSSINSAPSAIEWPSGRIDVFALGDDGAVYQKWYDGGFWFP